MTFLEFEKPLEELYSQLEKIKEVGAQGIVDVSANIKELETKILQTKKEIYSDLSGWEKVQMSRHADRPHTLYYINTLFDDFIELHGDRYFKDDKAIVGGIASFEGRTVMVIGHEKGSNTKSKLFRNFGMANPEGYRKALRLMKLAEKFGYPVITLIDTSGAYPGIEAEERGQAEAIAKNLLEMAQLETNILCYIIGEGASGGAIGIGLGDRVFMLENTWYSVISPESCSSILWRNWDHKEEAAEQLKLTAEDMLSFGLIDGIVKEPLGGAHSDPEKMAEILKKHMQKELNSLAKTTPEELLRSRLEKYNQMGDYVVVGEEKKK